MKALNNINKVFYLVSKKVASALLATLIISITIGVIARYVFRSPLTFTEELSTLLFIWIAFLGAVTASYDKRHVAVDMLFEKMPPRAQHIVRIFQYIAIMVFMVMLVISSFTLFPRMTHTTVTLKLPKLVFYIPVCISSIMMFTIYLEQMLDYLKNTVKRSAAVNG